MSKLKPCPFCGGQASCEIPDGELFWFAECEDCGNMTSGRVYESKAIERWNARANDKLTNFLKQCASFADSQDAFDSCALNGIAINAKALLDELNA